MGDMSAAGVVVVDVVFKVVLVMMTEVGGKENR